MGGCVDSDPPKPVVQAPPAPDPTLQPVDLTINRFNIRHGDKIVASISAQICRLSRGDSGTTTLAIDWEVQSILEDKVVYRTRTTGINKTRELDAQKNAVGMFIIAAWRDAAAKLVADSGFRQAIARKPETTTAAASAPVAAEPLNLPARAGLSGPLSANIEAVRRAAVTIDLGRGHGSGFFLTDDGWVLTNAHVARGSQTVKVILADGRTMFGQVMRVHDARDVALVKVDGSRFPALPLRAAPVGLTEEVYAIGTRSTRS
ncbi:MAG: trypsin-like peptidase domain-containing protein [Alphaproteobacteria bacterium]|nr:trypsin-like peptidase domain-containing protein [Alphaproteobacteria bacterium]